MCACACVCVCACVCDRPREGGRKGQKESVCVREGVNVGPPGGGKRFNLTDEQEPVISLET